MSALLKSSLVASLALGTSLLAVSIPARADDTAGEIAALKAELRRLEAKVNAQAREAQQTRSAVQGVVAHQVYTKGPLPVLASTCPPDKFCYKGITITPGGFLAAESVFRSNNETADVNSSWQNLQYHNVRQQHAQEFRFSARQSRLSILAEGNVDPNTKLSGYGEFDFLGAAQTANSNESNSYTPRIRHLYGTIDKADWGIHVLAGQTWSLATMFATGLQTRKENIPLSIDAQYVPGFVWARQPQIRVVKDFGPDFHAGFSLENPQTTEAGATPGAAFTFNQAALGGGLFNSANSLSLNHVPDLVGKVAWDPKLGDRTIHLEAFGVGRDFYSRFNGVNSDVFTGFGGGSVLVPILPKILDAQFSASYGEGVGRYGTAQFADMTVSPTGQVKPLTELALLVGVTWHALPSLDIYGYAGRETVDRKSLGTVGGVNYGYGNPANSNAGCNIEGSALTCTGNAREIQQATGGFWYDFYKGPYGQLRGGAQYSYTQKTAFRANVGGAPKTDENTFLTSLRYYPF